MGTRVGIAPGAGLVGRFGHTTIFIPRPGESVAELLALAASVGTEKNARAIAVKLAGWAVGHMGEDVGLVAAAGSDYVLFLLGAVSCTVTEGGISRELSGQQALTWIDQVIPATFGSLALSAPGQPVQVHPLADLQAGVVPGAGCLLTPAGGPRQPAREVPAPQPAAKPVALAPVSPAPDTAGQPTPDAPVPGTARKESRPGAVGLAEQGGVGPKVTLPRTPRIRALRSDDGLVLILDRSYVLGREPHRDPLAENGAATPIKLQDPEKMLSRVHSYVMVEGAVVRVRDAESVNGTFISPPGGSEWQQIGTSPVDLLPGWSMRLGRQVLVFDIQAPD